MFVRSAISYMFVKSDFSPKINSKLSWQQFIGLNCTSPSHKCSAHLCKELRLECNFSLSVCLGQVVMLCDCNISALFVSYVILEIGYLFPAPAFSISFFSSCLFIYFLLLI